MVLTSNMKTFLPQNPTGTLPQLRKRRILKGRNLLRPRRQLKASKKHLVTVEREAVLKRIREAQARRSCEKSLVTHPEPSQKRSPKRNRAVLMVRGPHWLHAFWEVTSNSVQRAKAAMGTEWHTARPVLRVLEIIGEKGETPVECVCLN